MANWSDITFAGGDTDYIDRLNALLSRSEANASEVEAARGVETTLWAQVQTRLTQSQVDARVAALAVSPNGLTANFSAGGFQINGLADPTAAQDAATRSWTLAQIVLGGDPGGVPITGLNVGTLNDGEFLVRSGSGLAGRRQSVAKPFFFASF